MEQPNAFLKALKEFFFHPSWRCNWCGVEIFKEEYFCEDCKSKLPYNDKAICGHCGRKLSVSSAYCSTCKNRIVNLDGCRSAFVYEKPIKSLIKQTKYERKLYLVELFAKYLAPLYFKSYFNADLICYVPMTKKALKNRGYNQSELLAQALSKHINVPVVDCIEKTKETKRQAKLNRAGRMKNLEGVFRVTDKSAVANKTVLIVDDVTTTGATAENIAKILKNANATRVYLLSVASVPSKEGY